MHILDKWANYIKQVDISEKDIPYSLEIDMLGMFCVTYSITRLRSRFATAQGALNWIEWWIDHNPITEKE